MDKQKLVELLMQMDLRQIAMGFMFGTSLHILKKQVQTWRYNEQGMAKLIEILS